MHAAAVASLAQGLALKPNKKCTYTDCSIIRCPGAIAGISAAQPAHHQQTSSTNSRNIASRGSLEDLVVIAS